MIVSAYKKKCNFCFFKICKTLPQIQGFPMCWRVTQVFQLLHIVPFTRPSNFAPLKLGSESCLSSPFLTGTASSFPEEPGADIVISIFRVTQVASCCQAYAWGPSASEVHEQGSRNMHSWMSPTLRLVPNEHNSTPPLLFPMFSASLLKEMSTSHGCSGSYITGCVVLWFALFSETFLVAEL